MNDTTIEWSVAKALYDVEWESVSENLRSDGFVNEPEEIQAYWLKSARAAIVACKEAVSVIAKHDACIWWREHKAHVDRLIASSEDAGFAYQPSGSDRFHPELWRPPHWRWLDREINGG